MSHSYDWIKNKDPIKNNLADKPINGIERNLRSLDQAMGIQHIQFLDKYFGSTESIGFKIVDLLGAPLRMLNGF